MMAAPRRLAYWTRCAEDNAEETLGVHCARELSAHLGSAADVWPAPLAAPAPSQTGRLSLLQRLWNTTPVASQPPLLEEEGKVLAPDGHGRWPARLRIRSSVI